MASLFEHVEIFKLLLQYPNVAEGVNIKNRDGETALIIASAEGHIEKVKLLLDVSIISVNIQDGDGYTALMRASYMGQVEIVKLLLEYPSTPEGVNIQNIDGDTALILASKEENVEIVKLLLNVVADGINIQNNDGETALTIVCYEDDEYEEYNNEVKRIEIRKLLLEYNYIRNPPILVTRIVEEDCAVCYEPHKEFIKCRTCVNYICKDDCFHRVSRCPFCRGNY
jgi:ankyrin repeat protein